MRSCPVGKVVIIALAVILGHCAQPLVRADDQTLADPEDVPTGSPCEHPGFRQFDFWIGHWELSSRLLVNRDTDTWETGRARNRIRADLDSCVIVEEFDGQPAVELRGMSVSTYDPEQDVWRQTWVDNQGGYLDFAGGLQDDGRMILKRYFKTARRTIHQRMVFANIAADSLDWYWERSTDDGQTWSLIWHLHYVRSE